jgi:hypothetical protein
MAEPFTLELAGGLQWSIDPPAEPHDVCVRTARVSIRAPGLQAHTIATFSDGPRDLALFFAELAADWRGWEGERHWRALEGELEVQASHHRARSPSPSGAPHDFRLRRMGGPHRPHSRTRRATRPRGARSGIDACQRSDRHQLGRHPSRTPVAMYPALARAKPGRPTTIADHRSASHPMPT